jgi:signal transduction histidine kinase
MRERARRAAVALGCAAALAGGALAVADLGAAEPAPVGREAAVGGAAGGGSPLGWVPLALVGAGGLSAGLTLRRVRPDAAESAAARVEAFARLAHDLRAPLTVIRGQCQSLRRGGPGLRHPARVDIIEAEAVRLSAAIDSLVDLARACPRAASGPPRAVAAGALLAELAERHRGAAEAQGVRIEIATPAAPVTLAADPDGLVRLLDNLVQNAVRHCPAGGAVRLSAASDGRRGVIRVSDDGPGVDPREADAIFVAGRRGQGAAGVGWGLGLAIARELAEAQRGRLDLERSGPGATFRLSLSLCNEPVARQSAPVAA